MPKPKRKKKKNPGCPAFQTAENQAAFKAVHSAVYPPRQLVIKQAIQYYTNRLTKEHLYRHGKQRYKEEITSTFEYDLKDYVRKHPDAGPLYYFREDPPDLGRRILKGWFVQHNPELQGIYTYVSKKGETVQTSSIVHRHLNRIWRSVVMNEVMEHFTLDVILNCVEENANYPFVAAGRAAREAILDEIPDSMPELFPKARKLHRHFILHIGPTNSGKTHDAVEDCMAAGRGIYLAPLRLLAMEIAERMNEHRVPCSLITGEEEQIIPGANHVASTVEMMDFSWYDVAVIDECQMAAEEERGWAWTQAILGVTANKIHACMAPEAENLVIQLIESCGDTWEKVEHHRSTPLKIDRNDFDFPGNVQEGDALVVFSRKAVLEAASILEDAGKKVSVIYGALPYQARRAETEKFAKGETRIVVTTDAIGMGMNLPVRRIVFLESQKFDGRRKRDLDPAEVKQIAGRAGRMGFEEIGWVNALYDKRSIAYRLKVPNTPITHARTMMPGNLIHMERPLSLIIRDWMGLMDQPPYQKASLDRNLKLCEYLEESCPLDREAMYRAMMIPFDESDRDLLAIWKKAVRNHLFERPILMDLVICVPNESDSLENLEKKYKKLDLLYSLLRVFPDREYTDEQKAYVLDCKLEVAQAIIERLKRKKRAYKRCKICGEALPWNYPYRICEACHERQHWYDEAEKAFENEKQPLP